MLINKYEENLCPSAGIFTNVNFDSSYNYSRLKDENFSKITIKDYISEKHTEYSYANLPRGDFREFSSILNNSNFIKNIKFGKSHIEIYTDKRNKDIYLKAKIIIFHIKNHFNSTVHDSSGRRFFDPFQIINIPFSKPFNLETGDFVEVEFIISDEAPEIYREALRIVNNFENPYNIYYDVIFGNYKKENDIKIEADDSVLKEITNVGRVDLKTKKFEVGVVDAKLSKFDSENGINMKTFYLRGDRILTGDLFVDYTLFPKLRIINGDPYLKFDVDLFYNSSTLMFPIRRKLSEDKSSWEFFLKALDKNGVGTFDKNKIMLFIYIDDEFYKSLAFDFNFKKDILSFKYESDQLIKLDESLIGKKFTYYTVLPHLEVE